MKTLTVAEVQKLGMTDAALDKSIQSIARTGKKWHNDVHTAAVAILVASLPTDEGGHTDCSRYAKLMAAMPKGSRANALKAWFSHFTNIRVNGDGKSGLLKPGQKGYQKVDVALASKTTFWDLTPEPAVPQALTDIELDAMVQRLLTVVQTAKDEGRLAVTATTMSSLGAVQKFGEALHRRAEAAKVLAKQAKLSDRKPAQAAAPRTVTPAVRRPAQAAQPQAAHA